MITRAYGSWQLLGESEPVCIAEDAVDDAGPWTVTFSPVQVKVVGSPAAPTALEAAAGIEPWQRAWAPFCDSAVVLTYGAQGSERLVLDYPIAGGILTVWASTVQVAGPPPTTAMILPSAYYRPIGAATLARGDRASPRRRWTTTKPLTFDPEGSGVALGPVPMRACGYRLVWRGAFDGTFLPVALTVEQLSLGTGNAYTDVYQRTSMYGGAGVGSNLHRQAFVPLVEGATVLRVTQPAVAPIPPDPAVYPLPLLNVQWLLDL